jgi:4,5-DOPA dioxygenase extradiol
MKFPVTEKMPVLFIGHGSPMNAIEENEFVDGIRKAGKKIRRPAAILCISAHWETKGTWFTAMDKPKTIHDFGGFPRELYEVIYPAPGSPELAEESRRLITTSDAGLDYKWGLDHGTWSVVRHLYPEADIPVVQMSLDYYKTAANHYDMAKEMSALRNRGVLVIGSGNMVHNLQLIDWRKLNAPNYGFNWALEAGAMMKKFIMDDDHLSLINYKEQGEAFDLAIPTPEHYLPLLYALALKENDDSLSLFNDKAVAGSLTMTSLIIGK